MLNKVGKIERVLKAYANDTSGATAMEYALIVAVLSIGLIAGFQWMSDNQNNLFDGLSNDFKKA